MSTKLPEIAQTIPSPSFFFFPASGCLVFFTSLVSAPQVFCETAHKSQIKPDF